MATNESEPCLPITQITIDLIVSTHVDSKIRQQGADAIVSALADITYLRLPRHNITAIENLECLGPVTNVYLQYNLIRTIDVDSLSCLTKLRFLTLAGNLICEVPDMRILSNLMLLDLLDNQISSLECTYFPEKLAFLTLKNNPINQREDYR